MKETNAPRAQSPRRIGIAEAKEGLSKVLREVAGAPVVIHNRGRDVAVLLDIEQWERLSAAEQTNAQEGGAALLRRIENAKLRHGGGVADFRPGTFELTPMDPLVTAEQSKRRKRSGR